MDKKNPRVGVKTRSASHSSASRNLATNMATVNNPAELGDDNEVDTPVQLNKQTQELIKKLQDLPERMTQLESRITKDNEEIQRSLKLTEDNTADSAATGHRIDGTLRQLRAELKSEKMKVRNLQYKLERAELRILHLETYSRKQNVVLEGLEEHEGEDTLRSVTNFFTEKMHLPPTISKDIDKSHRYGRSLHGKPRPVIVRFTKISTRDLVLRNVRHLRESRSKVYVNEDLPVEVKNQRADLRAIASYAKHLNIEAKMQGDTLTLDNRKYRHEDLDLLPMNLQLPAARTPKVADNIVGFYSRHSPLSNFHSCKLTMGGQDFTSVEQYFQYCKAELSTNEPAARKILLEADPLVAKQIGDRIQVRHTSVWHQRQK